MSAQMELWTALEIAEAMNDGFHGLKRVPQRFDLACAIAASSMCTGRPMWVDLRHTGKTVQDLAQRVKEIHEALELPLVHQYLGVMFAFRAPGGKNLAAWWSGSKRRRPAVGPADRLCPDKVFCVSDASYTAPTNFLWGYQEGVLK